MFVVQNSTYADPVSRHRTREEAVAAVKELLGAGLAEPREFNIVELEEDGDVVETPFGVATDVDDAKTSAA